MTMINPLHAKHYVKRFTYNLSFNLLKWYTIIMHQLQLKNWNAEQIRNMPGLVRLGWEPNLGNSKPKLLTIMLCYPILQRDKYLFTY